MLFNQFAEGRFSAIAASFNSAFERVSPEAGEPLNFTLGIMDTTHCEIVDYWARHQSECDLSVDWAEAEKLCWRCSQKRLLQWKFRQVQYFL